jgi:hypothetical protein
VNDELQRTWEKTGVESFFVFCFPIFSQGMKNSKGTLRVAGFRENLRLLNLPDTKFE